MAQLRLVFRVAGNRGVSAANGRLVVQLLRYNGRSARVQPAELKLRGVVEGLADIRFDPASITISVSHAPWPLRFVRHKETTVTLRGDDARELVDVGKRDATAGYAVLGNSVGDFVEVRLDNVRRTNGVVIGNVAASHAHGWGEYVGELALNRAGADSPKLRTTVRVGSDFYWAIGIVALGAILGSVVPSRVSVGKRRRELRADLNAAIDSYEAQLRSAGGTAASYDLENIPQIGRRPWDSGPRRGGGIRQLSWEIDRARTDEDFAKADATLTEKTGLINRWLRVEAPVARLREMTSALPEDLNGWSFEDSRIYGLMHELLDRTRRTPPSDEKAQDLLDQIQAKTVTLHLFKNTWQLQQILGQQTERMTPKQIERLNNVGLRSIDDTAPEVGGSDDVKESLVRSKLNGALVKLERLVTELFERGEKGRVSSSEDVPLATRIEGATMKVHETYGFGAEPAAISKPLWKRWPSLLNQFDILWTVLTVTVASAIYALTFYEEGTWGSPTDAVTAFAAGFGSKLVADSALRVNWSEVPPFSTITKRLANN